MSFGWENTPCVGWDSLTAGKTVFVSDVPLKLFRIHKLANLVFTSSDLGANLFAGYFLTYSCEALARHCSLWHIFLLKPDPFLPHRSLAKICFNMQWPSSNYLFLGRSNTCKRQVRSISPLKNIVHCLAICVICRPLSLEAFGGWEGWEMAHLPRSWRPSCDGPIHLRGFQPLFLDVLACFGGGLFLKILIACFLKRCGKCMYLFLFIYIYISSNAYTYIYIYIYIWIYIYIYIYIFFFQCINLYI